MSSMSQVRICNMALSNLGSRSAIEAITEKSVEAKQCKLWWDTALEQTLEAFDWSFARKRLTLSLHGDDAPGDIWSFRYQYPADCLAARELVNPLGKAADKVPYEIQISDDNTKSLLTNLEHADLVYTFLQSNTAMYSLHFVETISYNLAFHMAMALTGKRTIKADMFTVYGKMLLAAPAQNANESAAEPEREAEWIRAR